jgi:2-keto-4-pentenoate hydratase/2-oxohepta-3-ene-1,7-dioic acid hydratase in catechol pathway
MKLVTFYAGDSRDKYRVGLVEGAQITELTSRPVSAVEVLEYFDLDRGLSRAATSETIDLDSVQLAAPVPRSGKIICIGLNYRNHAIESGMDIPKSPIIFSKFSSCAIGAGEPILLPKGSAEVDYETELAFVIGRRAQNVNREDAMNYVFGYTNFNDVSARDFQFADGQWQRGKSCDTFAPFGPFVATADEIADPHDLGIRLRLNGTTLQDSNTSELIFKIPELIEFLSASVTLEPGDVIATGTPPGVGFARKPPVFMADGDIVEVEIDGLGILSNPVSVQ